MSNSWKEQHSINIEQVLADLHRGRLEHPQAHQAIMKYTDLVIEKLIADAVLWQKNYPNEAFEQNLRDKWL